MYSCGKILTRPDSYKGQTGWGFGGIRVTTDIPAFDSNKLCRYDRRSLDSQCSGCKRVTDVDYLKQHGLYRE